MKFDTLIVHSHQDANSETGAVMTPITLSSTFKQDGIGKHRGFEYSRTGNPTRKVLEEVLADMEGGDYGLAFASGSAATTAIFHNLSKDDHIVMGNDVYGGSFRIAEKIFKRWGLETSFADMDSLASFKQALKANTKLIWIEIPTNPLLKVADIEGLAAIAHQHDAILAVDNTFATPALCNPLSLGADLVVHSTTKYIGGHSDVVGGAVITNNKTLYKELKFYQNAAGAVPSPFDCFLTLRGIKTLALRMERHCQNASYIAEKLLSHPKVERVYYPGLPSNPFYQLAKKQMRGFGGMVSFEYNGDYTEMEGFISRLKVFTLAESLGGVESLVCYPPKMTHVSLTPEERQERGIKDNLLRLSVGIENQEDLWGDIETAMR